MADSAAGSSETWLPPWATLDVQRAQLEEVEELLALGAVTLAAPKEGPAAEVVDDGLRRMQRAVAEGRLLAEGPGLRCECKCGGDAGHVVVFLTLPLFYPVLPLVATIPRCKPERPEVLTALERVLREEALSSPGGAADPGTEEQGRALERAAFWLQASAPGHLQRLRDEFAASADGGGAAAEEQAAAAVEESAATARKKEKFSPNWDLCTSFAKTGKCKNKNCKWRHERPAETSQPVETSKQPADAFPPLSAAPARSKGKKK